LPTASGYDGGYSGGMSVGGHAGGGYHVQQRLQADKVAIDGKAVYMFGTGGDRMKKTEGKLVLCGQSGEIKIEVPNSDPLSAAEFAQLAKHKWKRPRQSIRIAHSDQSLEDFEYSTNAVPPGTCRRYPHERDTEEQQRAEVADGMHMRQLKKAHERNVRRANKRKVSNDPEHVGVVGQAELPEMRAGTWATSQEAPSTEISEVEFNRKVDKAHRTWKKNSSLLYDFVMIQMLECPSLTVQVLAREHTRSNTHTHSHMDTSSQAHAQTHAHIPTPTHAHIRTHTQSHVFALTRTTLFGIVFGGYSGCLKRELCRGMQTSWSIDCS